MVLRTAVCRTTVDRLPEIKDRLLRYVNCAGGNMTKHPIGPNKQTIGPRLDYSRLAGTQIHCVLCV